MIKQYTRLILDSDGDIKHCCTQTLPFPDDYEPFEMEETDTCIDCEIDADFENMDFRRATNQDALRAREIKELVEVRGGQPRARANGRVMRRGQNIADKLLNISAAKDITETTVKSEIAQKVRGLISESEFIAELGRQGRRITRLEDLPAAELIVAANAIERAQQ